MPIRTFAATCTLLTLTAVLTIGNCQRRSAQSQITIVVSVAAGGSSDLGMRTITAQVEKMGGPKIVIENRPGGGGVTATLGVKDAPPDGRTLMLASYATHVIKSGDGRHAVRSDRRFPADHHAVLVSGDAVRAQCAGSQDGAGAGRARQAQVRRPGLCLAGRRHRGTSARRTVPDKQRRTAGARPLQGRGAGGDRPGDGPGRHDVRRHPAEPAAPERTGTLRALAVTSRTRMRELPDVTDHGRGRPPRRQHGLGMVRADGSGEDSGGDGQEPARAVLQGSDVVRRCATSWPRKASPSSRARRSNSPRASRRTRRSSGR